MTKVTKRRQQAIDSKNSIYSTAIRLMESEGFERMTIEKISKEAGVSVGAFYHYFSSKNDILVELFKEADVFFVEKVANEIEGENAEDQILSYFHHFANFYQNYGIDIIKALYTTQNKLFAQKDRIIVRLLQEIVNRGVKNGEIAAKITNEEITDLMFCTARGVAYKWSVDNGQFSLEEVMLKYIAQLLRAFRPETRETNLRA